MRIPTLTLVTVGSLACHHPGTARVAPTPRDSANAVQATAARVAIRSAPSVVWLKCLDSAGRELSLGSGFTVAGGRVVTSVRLVRGCWSVELRDQSGDLLLTTRFVAAYCHLVDVAVLPAIPSPRTTLHITPKPLAKGQRIVVVGAPEGAIQKFSDGVVSAIRGGDDGRSIQITAPGSSGSPILNLHGDVVGMAVAHLPEQLNLTYAVPASAIAKALESSGPQRVAFTDIPEGQENEDAQGAQDLGAPALDDSAIAAGVRRAKTIVDGAVWDTASAQPCQRQKDTVCLRQLRDPFVATIESARKYVAAGFASRDSTVWLLTAAVTLSGGSKLAQAGAYDASYVWLDQLMKALARDSSEYVNAQVQQIRVQASFWFALADAVTLAQPYKQMVESKSCIAMDLVRQRIQRGLEALDVGASVAPGVTGQIRNILLQYSSNLPKVSVHFACDYC